MVKREQKTDGDNIENFNNKEGKIMDNKEIKVWGIHTKDDGLFLKEKLIAIGWHEVGDLSVIAPEREAFREKLFECYPDSSKQAIATNTGQLFRFVHEMQVGDYIVFPSKNDRMINIGRIEGDYYYCPDALIDSHQYTNRRKVKWIKHFPRTMFSQGALYEAGSALTIFMIKNYSDEYIASLEKGFNKTSLSEIDEDESVAATAEEIIQSTKDFVIKELSRQLKGYDFEEFIADLLRAMGYKATVSPKGGDSGIDVIAYKDELPPRIIVQVKSKDGDISEATLQSLKGAMMPGDYGFFITLSDYTKNARKFLEANPIIRGINGTELVELILKYYEKLSEKYQRIIPLEKVYIPVKNDEF